MSSWNMSCNSIPQSFISWGWRDLPLLFDRCFNFSSKRSTASSVITPSWSKRARVSLGGGGGCLFGSKGIGMMLLVVRLGFFCALRRMLYADPEMVSTEVAADGGFLSNKLMRSLYRLAFLSSQASSLTGSQCCSHRTYSARSDELLVFFMSSVIWILFFRSKIKRHLSHITLLWASIRGSRPMEEHVEPLLILGQGSFVMETSPALRRREELRRPSWFLPAFLLDEGGAGLIILLTRCIEGLDALERGIGYCRRRWDYYEGDLAWWLRVVGVGVGGKNWWWKVKSDLAGNKMHYIPHQNQKSQPKILTTFSDFDCNYSENNTR